MIVADYFYGVFDNMYHVSLEDLNGKILGRVGGFSSEDDAIAYIAEGKYDLDHLYEEDQEDDKESHLGWNNVDYSQNCAQPSWLNVDMDQFEKYSDEPFIDFKSFESLLDLEYN